MRSHIRRVDVGGRQKKFLLVDDVIDNDVTRPFDRQKTFRRRENIVIVTIAIFGFVRSVVVVIIFVNIVIIAVIFVTIVDRGWYFGDLNVFVFLRRSKCDFALLRRMTAIVRMLIIMMFLRSYLIVTFAMIGILIVISILIVITGRFAIVCKRMRQLNRNCLLDHDSILDGSRRRDSRAFGADDTSGGAVAAIDAAPGGRSTVDRNAS